MTIAIADCAKGVEVDLWGYLFNLTAVTKLTEEKIDAKLDEVDKRCKSLDFTKAENQIKRFGWRMDVWLEPAPGTKKKPSTILQEKWDAGELTVPQVNSFWESVLEENNRPL